MATQRFGQSTAPIPPPKFGPEPKPETTFKAEPSFFEKNYPEQKSTSMTKEDVQGFYDSFPAPRFKKGVTEFKEKATSSIEKYVAEHPEDRDLLKPAPLSSWMKSAGESVTKAALTQARFAAKSVDALKSATQPLFNNRILKTPSYADTVDFIAAGVGLPFKESESVKKEKGTILEQLHTAFVQPVKDGFEIAKLPPGKEKDEAFNAWAYKTVQSTLSGLSVGLTDEMLKENGVWMENGDLMWKNLPIDNLSELEIKGANAGALTGQLVGSLATYAVVSPMLTDGLRSISALNTVYESHPFLGAAILTNAAEEGFEAVVRKSSGQEYTFTDTIVGMMSGIAFETGKLALGKMSVDPELRSAMDADSRGAVDIEQVRSFLDDAIEGYTKKNGHVPDPNDLRALIGNETIPGTDMTVEMLHKQLASSGIKENRLVGLKGGEEGRPGIDFPAEPPKPEGDDVPLSKLTGGQEAEARFAAEGNAVRLKDLVLDPEQLKAAQNDIEMGELSRTETPIKVDDSNGTLKLVDGYHRYVQAVNEGKTFLPSEPVVPPARFAPETPDGMKVRKFSDTLQEAEAVAPETKSILMGSAEKFYKPITNAETLSVARKMVAENETSAISKVNDLSAKPTPEIYAMGQELIRKMSNEGRYEEAAQIGESIMQRSTDTAQSLQSLSMMSRMTPEGALVYAQRQMKNHDISRGVKEADFRKITPEQVEKITGIAKEIESMPDGEAKIIETARMLGFIEEMNPPSWSEKISSYQTIAMLLNPKTVVRNIVGNLGQLPAEFAQKMFSTPLDVAVSKLTGKRTVTLPAMVRPDLKPEGRFPGFYPMVNGMLQGIREAHEGVNTRATTGRFFADGSGSQRQKVFRNVPLLSQAESILSGVLRGPDRAVYEGAKIASLENQMRAAGLDFEEAKANDFKDVPEYIIEEAQLDANRAIFEESSRLRTSSVRLKKVLNLSLPIGIGDIVWKFPGIPANLLKRGLEYSPLGYVKFVTESVKGLRGKEFSQKQMVEAFGRASAGTVGSLGIGMKLAELGIITGTPGDDPDMNAIERKLGMGRYTVNMSAMKRYALSLDPKSAKKQEGDSVMSYDWFQPFAMNISIGANIYLNRKEAAKERAEGIFSTVLSSMEGSLESIEGLSMVQALRSFLYGDDSIIKRFLEPTKDAPASFVPTIFNQTRQLVDNISRETYDPNPLKESLNRVRVKIPGLSDNLPPRIDVTTGEPLEMYQDDSNNLFNVFFNPAFMTKVVKDKELQEILALYNSTGERTQAPKIISRTITIDGEDKKLTGKEISSYQQFVAEETRIYFDTIMNTPQYATLPDPLRVDILTKIIKGVDAAAKIDLFGADPSKQTRLSQSMVIMRRNRKEADTGKKKEYVPSKTDFNSVIFP